MRNLEADLENLSEIHVCETAAGWTVSIVSSDYPPGAMSFFCWVKTKEHARKTATMLRRGRSGIVLKFDLRQGRSGGVSEFE